MLPWRSILNVALMRCAAFCAARSAATKVDEPKRVAPDASVRFFASSAMSSTWSLMPHNEWWRRLKRPDISSDLSTENMTRKAEGMKLGTATNFGISNLFSMKKSNNRCRRTRSNLVYFAGVHSRTTEHAPGTRRTGWPVFGQYDAVVLTPKLSKKLAASRRRRVSAVALCLSVPYAGAGVARRARAVSKSGRTAVKSAALSGSGVKGKAKGRVDERGLKCQFVARTCVEEGATHWEYVARTGGL